MKGHENKKKYPIPITDHGEQMVWEKKKCMPCVVARIYIVGSLVVVERGMRVRRSCNIFNLAMENVLKGLPDKISCSDIIHKCTSNVHIFLINFKLRDICKFRSTCILNTFSIDENSKKKKKKGSGHESQKIKKIQFTIHGNQNLIFLRISQITVNQ
jgi:hypothetical protein